MSLKAYGYQVILLLIFIFLQVAPVQSLGQVNSSATEQQKVKSTVVESPTVLPTNEQRLGSAPQVANEPVPTATKVFSIENELLLERTPEAKMAKLDFLLDKQVSAKLSERLSQNDLLLAAEERKKLCGLIPGRCSDIRPWLQLICKDDVSNTALIDAFWQPVEAAVKNELLAKNLLQQIQSRCPAPSLGKLSVALRIMEIISVQSGWLTARREAQAYFEKEFAQKPMNLSEALKLVSPAIEKMRIKAPMPLDFVRAIGRTAAGWFKGLKQGDVDPAEATNFFGQIGVIAREGMLKPYAEAYLSAASLANTQFDGIVMMEVICYYLTISGQYSRCLAEVEKLKAKNSASQNLSVEMLLLQAKVHAFAGDLQSQYKIITGLLTKKSSLNNNILPWIYFDLAHVEMDLGWLEAANTHIQEHQRLVNNSNAPHFVKLIGYSLLVSISAVSASKESWQYVLKQAPYIRQQMEKNVIGVTETYAFLALDKIIASAFLQNGEVSKHLAELEAVTKELKYQDDIAELGRIIAAAAKGQFDPNAFNSLRQRLGPKYPRLVRVEKVVARLKAQKK